MQARGLEHERIAAVERGTARLEDRAERLDCGSSVGGEMRDDDHGGRRGSGDRSREHPLRGPRAQKPATNFVMHEESREAFEPHGVEIAWPDPEQDPPLGLRRRRQRGDLRQPASYYLGGEVFLTDVAVPCLPPSADLPHRREKHLIDGTGEAEISSCLLQQREDRCGVECRRGSHDRVDPPPSGVGFVKEPEHPSGGVGRRSSDGDFIAHQAQLIEVLEGVATVPTNAPCSRGEAIAPFPRTQRRRGNAEKLASILDRHPATGLSRADLNRHRGLRPIA